MRDLPTAVPPGETIPAKKIQRRPIKEYESYSRRTIGYGESLPRPNEAVLDDLNRENVFSDPDLPDAKAVYRGAPFFDARTMQSYERTLDEQAKLNGRTDYLRLAVMDADRKHERDPHPATLEDLKEYAEKLLALNKVENPQNQKLQPQEAQNLESALLALQNAPSLEEITSSGTEAQKQTVGTIIGIAKNLNKNVTRRVNGGLDRVRSIAHLRLENIMNLCNQLNELRTQPVTELGQVEKDNKIFLNRRQIRFEAEALAGFAKNFAAYNHESRGLDILAMLAECGFELSQDEKNRIQTETEKAQSSGAINWEDQLKKRLEELPVKA